MKVSVISVAVLLVIVACISHAQFSSTPVPLFLWSGKQHSYLKGNYKHAVCTEQKEVLVRTLRSIMDKQKNKFVKGLKETPEAFVFFIHDSLGADDFMRFAGAFGSQKSFKHLENHLRVESGSSLVFPSCSVKRGDKAVNSIVSAFQYTQTAFHYAYENAQGKASLAELLKRLEGASAMTPGKTDVFLIFFDEVATDNASIFAKHDETMNTIISKISALTLGNFIAGFTANHGSDVTESSNVNTLSDYSDMFPMNTARLMESNGTSNTSNSTTSAAIYIDETIVGATLISLIMFFALLFAFKLVLDIQTSPHIADILQGEEPKKNR